MADDPSDTYLIGDQQSNIDTTVISYCITKFKMIYDQTAKSTLSIEYILLGNAKDNLFGHYQECLKTCIMLIENQLSQVHLIAQNIVMHSLALNAKKVVMLWWLEGPMALFCRTIVLSTPTARLYDGMYLLY